MPQSVGSVGRKLNAVRCACARVKTQRATLTTTMEAAKPKVMTKLPSLDVGGSLAESCYVCLASLLPCAVFSVAGSVSAFVAGPAAVLSVLLAAGAVAIAGNLSKYFKPGVLNLECRHALGCQMQIRGMSNSFPRSNTKIRNLVIRNVCRRFEF